ncbi:unnamed protein product [Schistosoma turkestanicum]|nr:unnamed protein product [Schistosoma turkestanicum]
MKLNKKLTEIPANNQFSRNFDPTCEFHMNPGSYQSNVNLMNSNLSDSVGKSISNPICSDSYLCDTTMNQLLTLKSDTAKKAVTNTSDCPMTPFISKTSDLFNTIGYPTGQMHTDHEFQHEIINTESKTLPSCKLSSKIVPYIQTVPHFIYINNPSNNNNNNTNNNDNNQLTELKTFTSTKHNPSSVQSVKHEQAIVKNCEHILENNRYVCPNYSINSLSTSLCECKRGESDFDFSNILFNNPSDYYYPIHEIHNHQKLTQIQLEQQEQPQQHCRSKTMMTQENSIDKSNSITSCMMMNYEPGENLIRSRMNLSTYFKWCHRKCLFD